MVAAGVVPVWCSPSYLGEVAVSKDVYNIYPVSSYIYYIYYITYIIYDTYYTSYI
uniref:Uncharacterized protein n=1 Tax=Anas platyrhynchos platyrhynchos TaxID=8840 RepID=A0A493SYD0_ANAPP